MDTITGNARHDAEQRLDSIDHHLVQLRALVVAGGLDQSPDPAPAGECEHENDRSFESVMTETFGHWVLDLLGLGGVDAADAVRQARPQLVGALSRQVAQASTAAKREAEGELRFVDVFAGDDLSYAPDEELGVKPISYEA